MNDPIEHATGLEKRELLAKLAGNEDPYHMNAIKRGVSTKEKPTLIPSAFEARIIGCICKCSLSSIQRNSIIFDKNSKNKAHSTSHNVPQLNIVSFFFSFTTSTTKKKNRPWRSDTRSMDVVAPGHLEALRMWPLVQIVRSCTTVECDALLGIQKYKNIKR